MVAEVPDISPEAIQALYAELDSLRESLSAKDVRIRELETQLQRALSESSALYMTSLDISSQLDLNSTLSSVLRRLVTTAGFEAGLAYLLDQTTGDWVVGAEYEVMQSLVGQRARTSASPLADVRDSGSVMVLEQFQAHLFNLHGVSISAMRTAILLPLRWQGNVIGIVILLSAQERTLDLDDLDTLHHISVHAAIAIHNAQQYTAEQDRNRQLAMLYRASVQVTGSLELDAVLQAASVSFVEVLRVPVCNIYEYQPNDGLHLISHHSTHLGYSHHLIDLPELPNSMLEFLGHGQWVVVQRSDPTLQRAVLRYLDQRQAYSLLLIPIAYGENSIGLIELLDPTAPRQFLLSEINTAQTLAANISIAVSHAQLHTRLRVQRISEQATLLDLAQQLLETDNEQSIADEVCRAAADALEVTHVNLALATQDGLASRAVLGWDASLFDGRLWHPDDGTGIGYAARMRELVVMDDVFAEARFQPPPFYLQTGMRSSILAPLIYGGTVLGVLAVSRPRPSAFTPDDVRLLSLITTLAAAALDRVRLMSSIQAQNADLERRVQQRTREIRSEQERTVAILLATGESLIVFGADGTVQLVNRAFEIQHGYVAAETQGRSSADFLGFDVFTRLQETPIHPSGFQIWRGELVIARKDGTTFDAAVTLSPVQDAKGATIGIVASIRDISYFKEVDRMKNALLSNVSHELRTPLANLKLYLHLLAKGTEDRRAHYLNTMLRESDRLQVIIEDLLTLSRLEFDHQVVDLQLTDLNKLVMTLVDDRRRLAQERNLELICLPYETSLIANVDQNMITQAVGNLISNAMNYTLSGGRIEVRLQVEAGLGGAQAVISVSDTGLGISEEDQTKLFERFFRGTAAKHTGAAGTGLGMPIVREIMLKHHGSITFESHEGEGTIFFLRLPNVQIDATELSTAP